MNNILERKIAKAMERGAMAPDGMIRSPADEEKINSVCRAVFASPNGKLLMGYLRAITTDVVVHPTATDAELRDREGMRRLVGILQNRASSAPQEK